MDALAGFRMLGSVTNQISFACCKYLEGKPPRQDGMDPSGSRFSAATAYTRAKSVS